LFWDLRSWWVNGKLFRRIIMKIYCVSDLHIGYEHSNYKKIQEFFKLVEENANKLILCGDVLDLWRCPIENIRGNGKTKPNKKVKTTFDALCDLSDKMDITYIWGNHDYKVAEKWKEAKDMFKITNEFTSESDNIHYCHGWRFDIQQRMGYWLYGWLVNQFPYFYQKFFKTPFEAKEEEEGHSALSTMVHDEARRFIKDKKVKYLIMGHTHDPCGKKKLYDCGDMVDSLSYIIVENGKPRLERLPRK
jgi:UDP-2,3-diacylglucosamine pyrophosphatase LpxH